MLLYCLQIYFIFVLHIIIQANCSTAQGNETTEKELSEVTLSGEKCESQFCSCADFQKLNESSCINYPVKYIYRLVVSDNMTVPSGILPGYSITTLVINRPYTNVDENIFEKIVALKEFRVSESSIQVTYLII